MNRLRGWAPWLAIVAVADVALAVGASGGDDGPRTPAARAASIAAEVRCPTCRGLSAAESDAKAARAVRDEIRRRVDAGEGDAEIKAYLASRYGEDILLRPPATGAGALVWALPAAGLVVAGAGLGLTLRRWRRAADPDPPEAAPVRGSTRRRGAVVTAGVVLVAVGAGAALAASAGDRRPGDPLTGSIESTAPKRDPRIAQAQRLIADGKAVDAFKLLDRVIEEDPDNAEALAYRGWYLVQIAGAVDDSLADKALEYIDRAIAADPSYPDAHFFRGMVVWRHRGAPAEAAAEFRLFLANDPPAAMVKLVEEALSQALAEAQAAGQTVPTSTTVAVPADPEGG